MNNMSPLKSCLQEVAKFLFLCDWTGLWTAVLNANTKSLKTGHKPSNITVNHNWNKLKLFPEHFLLVIQQI